MSDGIIAPDKHTILRRKQIGRQSLESLAELRLRLLPDLEELTICLPPPLLRDLQNLLTDHYSLWLDKRFPPFLLPAKILRSNIAAFAASALDKQSPNIGADRAGHLWHDWFINPQSPLVGAVKPAGNSDGGGHFFRFWRTVCCLRDEVEGVALCASCPRRKGRATAPALVP